MSGLRISADRLLGDLARLAAIGGRPDGGVDRVAGSDADREARRWLAGRMREAGLEPRTDPVGSVFGRLPESPGPWLLVGSHTDTVPAGGRLDGAYGVVAALEVARALIESRHAAAPVVEVVSFWDEEGAGPGGGVVGSRALCQSPHVRELRGYLEIHIEQGPRMVAEGVELAVVEGIVGISRFDVILEGEPNHAGTTPFPLRKDAGRAAARVVAGLREMLSEIDPEMVGNAGVISFAPGAPNVVPGRAEIVVEMRSIRPGALERGAGSLRARVADIAREEGCAFQVRHRSGSGRPQFMDAGVIAALERACARVGRPWRRLVSGAGHDAGMLALEVPAGMLFVPSTGGISHSPREHTEDRLLVQGAEALLEGTLEILH
ncbi:MAG: M20/M25/M40 family metallo-hydrolase [Candidatus Dormibacteraceae bacterium]